jgi:hypothetical protein
MEPVRTKYIFIVAGGSKSEKCNKNLIINYFKFKGQVVPLCND